MALLLVTLFVIAALVLVVYLLGFRLGIDGTLAELQRVRREAVQAERRLHELTRQAFTAMAEEVEKRRGPQ